MFIIIRYYWQAIKPARFVLSKLSDCFNKPMTSIRRTLSMQESLISLLIALVSALLIVVSFVIYIGL